MKKPSFLHVTIAGAILGLFFFIFKVPNQEEKKTLPTNKIGTISFDSDAYPTNQDKEIIVYSKKENFDYEELFMMKDGKEYKCQWEENN